MRVVLLSPDLLFGSRIAGIVESAGQSLSRVDDLVALPPPEQVDLLLVDWANRHPAWAEELAAWQVGSPPPSRTRVIVFGPHTDLVAHDEARSAGLGPMWARSRILSALPKLIASGAPQ